MFLDNLGLFCAVNGDDGLFSNDSALTTCVESISFERSQLLIDDYDDMMMIGGLNITHY